MQEKVWSKLESNDKKAIRTMSKYLKIIWIISMIICPIGHLSYESYIPVIVNSKVGSTQKMIKISLEVLKWTVWSTLNLGWLIASVSFYSFFILL